MPLKLRKWDVVEHLKTDEDMVLYLEAAMEEAGDDAAFIAKVLGDIARAKGMTQLARDTGIGRESLYKALSGQGNPSFATILKVVHALGVSAARGAGGSSEGAQGRPQEGGGGVGGGLIVATAIDLDKE